MSLANLIAKFLESHSNRLAVDDFISLDKDGNARFDLAAYLNSAEGQNRIEAIASEFKAEAKGVDEAA